MDIYIKANKKVSIFNKGSIKIEDVAEVFAPNDMLKKISAIPLRHIDSEEPQNLLISVIDVIKAIEKSFPGNTVSSVGEPEVLVHFERHQESENKLFTITKVICVCLILVAGSATAIMSFHTDSQVPTIFKNFYYIFFNESTESLGLIDIPYSIGLAVGIIVFFNHFSSKKTMDDPTPLDVELSVYEEDVVKTMVDKISVSQTTIGKKE